MLYPADDQPTLSTTEGPVQIGKHALSAGECIAGRFRIVRFIGHGGMGEVYEAEDLELREHVALKTIRPEVSHDEGMLARFRNEIQLAHKVTHPNVCRIFDLARHGEILFLTMELLQGESLAARLRRGPMAEAEALPLVRQMVMGLAAAQEAGIVHRDFKSSNVMLVPKREDDSGVRAVITDFGLAQTLRRPDSSQTELTSAGVAVGTPAYMAPEQLEGGPVTAATDIYALGEVLYEMVTGKPPFAGPSPIAAAVRRLKEQPPSPREHAPQLDPKWEEAILRCLKRKPEERFSSALDVLAALEGAPRATEPRWWMGAVAALLLAGVGGVYFSRLDEARHSEPVKLRPAVAVIGFKNLSGRNESAWLSTALSEMVSTELAAGEKLRTVPGESVGRMRLELSLADADSFGKDTLARIRNSVAADYVVVGSYLLLANTLRVYMRLQDAKRGETISLVTDNGAEAELPALVSRTGAQLREKLGVRGLSPSDAAAVRAAIPGNPEGRRLYAEGLEQLRLFNALGARDRLEQAVAADPRHPLIRSALSASWAALGYDIRAAQEAKKALDLAANLGREDRLWVEGLYREAGKEWPKAIELFRTLYSFFPDNLEYGLRLIAAQTAGGQAKEALGTIAQLRRLPSPASDDPRIDIAEALADDALADYTRMLAASLKAVAKSSSHGARLLWARARLLEGHAHWRLGAPQNTVEASEDARRVYSEVGDQVGVANALNQLANVISLKGDLKGGDRLYRRALEMHRQAGNKSGLANALNNLGINRKDQGDPAGARKMHEEALAIRREIGDRLNEAVSLNNLAVLLFEAADLAGAKQLYQQSLAISRELGDRRNMVRAMLNTAIVLEHEGNLEGARKLHEESLAVRRQIGDKRAISLALHNLSGVLFSLGDLGASTRFNEEALAIDREMNNKRGVGYELFTRAMIRTKEGRLEDARKLHEEALAVRTQAGEETTAAESRLTLAELALLEGQPREAASAAQSLLPRLRSLNVPQLEVMAQLIVAEALLAQGRPQSSSEWLARASTKSAQRDYRTLRFNATILKAKIQAAFGNFGEAGRLLESVMAEAAQCGYGGYKLETGLLLGQVELKSGKLAEARARLNAIEREAAAKGFGLVARQAAATLRP